MAITIKNDREIALMRESGRLLALVHEQLRKELKEGMTTKDLDRICEEMIRDFGCVPNFLNYEGFPASVCVSINNEVVHGIPSDDRYIKNGDIVSLDAGLIYKGYHSDAARTWGVGDVSEQAQRLMDVTKQSFFEGIKYAKPGNHLSDIARGIQTYAQEKGYSVVRDLTGHGIGTHLHEAPEVPNFVSKKRGVRLQKGMTLAVEPMINEGKYGVYWMDNDWTVATADGKLSSHYENTIAITEDGCEILTMLPEEK
ncbi:MAG: type I methionyl aminopeptidase [Eubacterium sp.]|nr:type I methionyl aminopeptidase [Eubacterium sp.]MDD7210025.1 type I methionyl aminopeptidase [Lachnospiraceae bacterium]MDY5496992.1 type I methionyl aminopeptidase [Anaerobutyricum sp.]